MINRTKIAIIRGGCPLSLQNGLSIINNLSKEKYIALDIVVDKENRWYNNGFLIKPEKFLKGVDLVFNVYSEKKILSKKIDSLLNSFNIQHINPDNFSNLLSYNKKLSKDVYKKLGIKTPYYQIIKSNDYSHNKIIDIFRSVPAPYVIKPVQGGFSAGIKIAKSLDELKIFSEATIKDYGEIIIEEFISGKEVVCHTVNDFRDQPTYSFLPIEVNKLNSQVIDEENRLNGTFETEVNVGLSKNEKELIQNISKEVHKHMGFNHYSQSDFIVSKRGIYILETNNVPELHEKSFFLKALESVGSKVSDFLEHLIFKIKHPRL